MHKYLVGQAVDLVPRKIREAASGTYEIIRLLPLSDNGGEPTYRIKSKLENHERVMVESEMTMPQQMHSLLG